MKYFLYSGCSLESSASHYLISVLAMAKPIDIEFIEIEDWNCCGASISYIGAGEFQLQVLNARNLALAEAHGAYDIVAPCSSCYIMANKINRELQEDPELLTKVNLALAEGGLKYSGSLKVRHLLDVLYNDIGLEKIKSAVKKPLLGLSVAGYVGCQTTRPYGEYDSVERPHVQDDILAALGANVIDFSRKMQCCGSGIFLPELEKSLVLVKDIIEETRDNGAQVISTACPMCQMNLEIYQGKINKAFRTKLNMPVVFISQLMAAAFGLNLVKEGAFNRNIVPALDVVAKGFAEAPKALPEGLSPEQRYQIFIAVTLAGQDAEKRALVMREYGLDEKTLDYLSKKVEQAALSALRD